MEKGMAQAARKQEFTEEQIMVGQRLHGDYEYYAPQALKIKPKDKNAPGVVKGLLPYRFNTAQRYLHWILEKQKREIGRVRAYVLKGRQQGCSTYIEGRYFHKTSLNYGIKTFIQTHSKIATGNLYSMAKRYLNNLTLDIKPRVGISNTTALVFDELDSGYAVGTAGSAETGRSDTIDLLHGSEVAFWKSSLDHTAGLLQAVPDVPGSEIILESTANGMGGFFHKGFTTAQAGLNGDYIAVFIPWYWQEEYKKSAPVDFALTEKEAEYVSLYDDYPEFDENGDVTIIKRTIDNDQMYWRRCKIAEFEGSEDKCNQEYPFTAEMAFQFSAVESHIKAKYVNAALARPQYRSYGAIVAGFDPSFTDSGDRKAFVYRQGGNMWGLEYPKLKDHDAQVAYLDKKLQGAPFIDKLYVDFGGGGINIVQSLHNLNTNYVKRVKVVNSANADIEPTKHKNLRAGMSERFRLHLMDNDMPLSIDISDKETRDAFLTDVTAESITTDNNNRLIMEKKEKVKVRLGISPDGSDAGKLTYAENFVREHVMGSDNTSKAPQQKKTPFRSLKQRR
jgi:hypothetical protein